MTGAGTFVHEHLLGRFESEARSVNHRFLKTTWRTQGPLPDLTLEVEERVRARLARGHVTLTLRFTPNKDARGAAALDRPAFLAAAAELQALVRAAGLPAVSAAMSS